MRPSNRSSAGPRLAYSLAGAAEITGLSVRSLRYLMTTGKLGFARIGRRVLIRHADLQGLLRRGYVKAATPLNAEEHIRPDAGSGAEREPAADGQ